MYKTQVILKAVQVLENPLQQLYDLLRALKEIQGEVPTQLEEEVVRLLTSAPPAIGTPRRRKRSAEGSNGE